MKVTIAIIILVIAVIMGVIAGWFYVSKTLFTPIEHSKSDAYITIERGTTPQEIITQLSNDGIIRSSFITKVYVRLFRDSSNMQAGEYQFKSPISTVEVLDELENGRKRTIRLTIPEGWTRFEIAKRISSKFRSDPSISENDVLEMMNDTSQIKDFDPTAKNVEGYLYPTTYELPPETPPKKVVETLVSQFRKKWNPNWTLEASKRQMTVRQIITIASLIENESKIPAERPIVSSVIYNRLKLGMPLGIDATNVYVAKLRGRWDGVLNRSDLDINHPYNTRKINGLPPGPISSASESALEAAIAPATTPYLYYVLNVEKNDGSHNFYSSSADFERGKRSYQKWLQEQRKK